MSFLTKCIPVAGVSVQSTPQRCSLCMAAPARTTPMQPAAEVGTLTSRVVPHAGYPRIEVDGHGGVVDDVAHVLCTAAQSQVRLVLAVKPLTDALFVPAKTNSHRLVRVGWLGKGAYRYGSRYRYMKVMMICALGRFKA